MLGSKLSRKPLRAGRPSNFLGSSERKLDLLEISKISSEGVKPRIVQISAFDSPIFSFIFSAKPPEVEAEIITKEGRLCGFHRSNPA